MKTTIQQVMALRNNIEGCLKAAPAPMGAKEVYEWPSVHQLVPGRHGYQSVLYHLKQMAKEGRLGAIKAGKGSAYFVNDSSSQPAAVMQDLDIQVNREKGEISLKFKGLNIRISVE
jgi:hypothetical protein